MLKLVGIAYKTKKGAPVEEVFCANVTRNRGVERDVFGRPGKRQVTVMSQDQWLAVCDELNAPLPWITRRANLLVKGHQFSPADKGKKLQIGELILEITGETDPCKKMEIAHTGLEAALTPHWRGGVTCTVIQDGLIQVDDDVALI